MVRDKDLNLMQKIKTEILQRKDKKSQYHMVLISHEYFRAINPSHWEKYRRLQSIESSQMNINVMPKCVPVQKSRDHDEYDNDEDVINGSSKEAFDSDRKDRNQDEYAENNSDGNTASGAKQSSENNAITTTKSSQNANALPAATLSRQLIDVPTPTDTEGTPAAKTREP